MRQPLSITLGNQSLMHDANVQCALKKLAEYKARVQGTCRATKSVGRKCELL